MLQIEQIYIYIEHISQFRDFSKEKYKRGLFLFFLFTICIPTLFLEKTSNHFQYFEISISVNHSSLISQIPIMKVSLFEM